MNKWIFLLICDGGGGGGINFVNFEIIKNLNFSKIKNNYYNFLFNIEYFHIEIPNFIYKISRNYLILIWLINSL